MAKKNSRNNKFLYDARDISTPKIYNLLIDLVNKDREDLAEHVKKIDYLLEYAGTCIKQKDMKAAKEALEIAESRIKLVKEGDGDTSYLEYLAEGIRKKIK